MTATGFETQYTKVSGLWISVSALTTMSSFIPHSSPLLFPLLSSPPPLFNPLFLTSFLPPCPCLFSFLVFSPLFFHFLSSSVLLNHLVPAPFLLISLFLSIIFSSFCLFLCQPPPSSTYLPETVRPCGAAQSHYQPEAAHNKTGVHPSQSLAILQLYVANESSRA